MLAKKISVQRFLLYVVMQLAGAITGSALVFAVRCFQTLVCSCTLTGSALVCSCRELHLLLCCGRLCACMYVVKGKLRKVGAARRHNTSVAQDSSGQVLWSSNLAVKKLLHQP